nr:hypothetical protein [Natrarchaeobius halalkaliphilus]
MKYKSVRLLIHPQRLDAFLDEIEDETTHVAMVVRPPSVLRVGTTGVRRRMEVVS